MLRGDNVIASRDVIARIEELRDQLVPLFIFGYNMPGYGPDMEPQQYDDEDEALEALRSALQERLDELEDDAEREDDCEALREALGANPTAEGEIAFTVAGFAYWIDNKGETGLDDDEREELEELEALAKEGEAYCDDWHYGSTFIREDYFQRYAEEFAEDIGLVNRDATWPNNHIDWESAADDLRQDYTELKFGDETYLAR